MIHNQINNIESLKKSSLQNSFIQQIEKFPIFHSFVVVLYFVTFCQERHLDDVLNNFAFKIFKLSMMFQTTFLSKYLSFQIVQIRLMFEQLVLWEH